MAFDAKQELKQSLEQWLENETSGRGEWLLGAEDEGSVHFSKGVLSVRYEDPELGEDVEQRFRIELVPIP